MAELIISCSCPPAHPVFNFCWFRSGTKVKHKQVLGTIAAIYPRYAPIDLLVSVCPMPLSQVPLTPRCRGGAASRRGAQATFIALTIMVENFSRYRVVSDPVNDAGYEFFSVPSPRSFPVDFTQGNALD